MIYYHSDASGNITALTDDSENTTAQYAYSPYGTILAETGNIANPYKFAGSVGIMEELPGLYFMRARYYSADACRFLSTDPLKNIGPGWKPSVYLYSSGNPLIMIDPDGRDPVNFIIKFISKKQFAETMFSDSNPIDKRRALVDLIPFAGGVINFTWDSSIGEFNTNIDGIDLFSSNTWTYMFSASFACNARYIADLLRDQHEYFHEKTQQNHEALEKALNPEINTKDVTTKTLTANDHAEEQLVATKVEKPVGIQNTWQRKFEERKSSNGGGSSGSSYRWSRFDSGRYTGPSGVQKRWKDKFEARKEAAR